MNNMISPTANSRRQASKRFTGWKLPFRPLACLFAFALLGAAVQAGLPEPGARIYGSVVLNGATVTATNTAISVEVRGTPAGAALAKYQMGSLPAAGNFYSLKVNAEDLAPLASSTDILIGGALYIVVTDATGDRDQKQIILPERGSSLRVDFGSADTDGDGMPDDYELQNFGSITGGDPNADPDHDGRSNLLEFLQGTNPNVPDGRHPADLSPADDRITLAEVTDYILAWKTGGTWPLPPALNSPNIEDYVTRAGALWKGGEVYIFDNDPATNAPMWWVNPPLTNSGTPGDMVISIPSSLDVTRTLPASYVPNQPIPVSISVTPSTQTKAYAVVETPPPGWNVRNLSNDARWDAVNRKIKWGPFFDQTPRTLTYQAVPGPASAGAAVFAGRGSFDGYGFSAAGPLQVWPPGQTPAAYLAVAGTESSGVALLLHGEPGRSYQLQSSDDLAHWNSMTALTLDAQGQAAISAVEGANARFYRLLAGE